MYLDILKSIKALYKHKDRETSDMGDAFIFFIKYLDNRTFTKVLTNNHQ